MSGAGHRAGSLTIPPPILQSPFLSSSVELWENSYFVELFHSIRLQLIKGLKVLLLQQLVSVDPVALVQVDFEKVQRGFQTLAGTEEEALGRQGEEAGSEFHLAHLHDNREGDTAQSLWVNQWILNGQAVTRCVTATEEAMAVLLFHLTVTYCTYCCMWW